MHDTEDGRVRKRTFNGESESTHTCRESDAEFENACKDPNLGIFGFSCSTKLRTAKRRTLPGLVQINCKFEDQAQKWRVPVPSAAAKRLILRSILPSLTANIMAAEIAKGINELNVDDAMSVALKEAYKKLKIGVRDSACTTLLTVHSKPFSCHSR